MPGSAVPVPELAHGLVHHLRRHRPVSRELPAYHRQHPSRPDYDGVLAGAVRRDPPFAIQHQGPEPGPGGPHVLDAQPSGGSEVSVSVVPI
jgi:hypothetical protein